MFSWKSCCSGIPQRWVFSILGSLGICIGSVYQVIISITIVEMILPLEESFEQKIDGTCEDKSNVIIINKTSVSFQNVNNSSKILYDWDEYTQGIILSSYFWTYSLAQCFCGIISERFGALVASRALMGIPNASMYPASSTLVSRWTTSAERTRIGNTVYAGQLPGLFIGTVVPALIMKYSGTGWPAVFYFFGIIGIIWFIVWCMLVYDSPEQHPFISDEELAHLQSNKSMEECYYGTSPPWKHILMCKEFWAFTICASGSNWSYYSMITDLPKYMSGVVKFSIEDNGYFSSVPYLFMWFNANLSTWISDKAIEKRWVSLTNIRKIFGTISVTGPSVFLLLASYAECNKVWVVGMFFIGITAMGSLYPSILMNPLDLSPRYAGSIMSLGNGIGALVGIVIPYITGVLTPNQTIGEWRLVFWIVFIFSLIPNLIYLLWFNAEVKNWNDLKTIRNKNTITRNNVDIELEAIIR
ncbi:sialin-like isoform X2 [Phymastichus coffea]|uniref:sialin-like isoform X2 n=1 Tax=Phymastichus coffea TaxID=108790 RepID=UPI00273B0996|nr:sialin-like isoform X2 [Phymastichus coffea]